MATRKRTRGRPAAAVESTREALLRAGTELFAERGFEGASVDVIARRAGANKAMINYHFRSKKGLYEAILIQTFTDLHARVAAVRSHSQGAAEALQGFIAAFVGAAAARPAFPNMLLREVAGGGTHMPREVIERLVAVADLVVGIVEQGIRDGSFRKVHPFMTHASLIGAMTFFLATERMRMRVRTELDLPVVFPTIEDYVAHLQEFFIRGLAKEPAAQKRSGR